MHIQRSELTSMATALRELTERFSSAGEGLQADGAEEAALALFEAERGLRAAARAMDRGLRALGA